MWNLNLYIFLSLCFYDGTFPSYRRIITKPNEKYHSVSSLLFLMPSPYKHLENFYLIYFNLILNISNSWQSVCRSLEGVADFDATSYEDTSIS